MSESPYLEGACCAHLKLVYRTEPAGEGGVTGFWWCDDCKHKFTIAVISDKPQWKPGQMLFSRTGIIIKILDLAGSLKFATWKEGTGWQSWGMYPDLAGFEPYPRIGDWVRCIPTGKTFRVQEFLRVNGIESVMGQGHWAHINSIEPASPREPEKPARLSTSAGMAGKLEGPHWEHAINFPRNPEESSSVRRDLDLREAVRDLQSKLGHEKEK